MYYPHHGDLGDRTSGRSTRLVSAAGRYLSKISLKIIDKTAYFSSGKREDEIKDWLDRSPEFVESFVILDDGDYDWYRHGYDKHLVKTDFCTGGLRQEHVKQAIDILNRKRFLIFSDGGEGGNQNHDW